MQIQDIFRLVGAPAPSNRLELTAWSWAMSVFQLWGLGETRYWPVAGGSDFDLWACLPNMGRRIVPGGSRKPGCFGG